MKISTQHPEVLAAACEHFLDKNEHQIETLVTATLEGHQRGIMGTMTVEVYNDICLFIYQSPFIPVFPFSSFMLSVISLLFHYFISHCTSFIISLKALLLIYLIYSYLFTYLYFCIYRISTETGSFLIRECLRWPPRTSTSLVFMSYHTQSEI